MPENLFFPATATVEVNWALSPTSNPPVPSGQSLAIPPTLTVPWVLSLWPVRHPLPGQLRFFFVFFFFFFCPLPPGLSVGRPLPR